VNSGVSIFPNPRDGIINVLIGNTMLPLNFDIVDFNGIIVHMGSIDSDMQQVDLSILPKGIYLIRFYTKEKIYTEKISLIY
jgi:hypothetical protein